MNEPINDGPAFPVLSYERSVNGDLTPVPTIESGMSLREWYAGMALQGFCAANRKTLRSADELARACFFAADAMVAEAFKSSHEATR